MLVAVTWLVLLQVLLVAPSASAQECNNPTLRAALQPYDACLNNIMDQLFNQRGVQDVNLQSYLTRTCESVSTNALNLCHQGLEQRLNFCVSFNQRQLLDVLKSSSWSGLRYICQDSARWLTEFRENGQGFECLQRSDRFQSECMARTPILSMYIDRYEGQFCEVTQPEGLACLRRSFQQAGCSDIASQFLNGYYSALTEETPCATGSGNKRQINVAAISIFFFTFTIFYFF